MNKYRELFEKYVAEVGRAPHALTRVWVLGFCDWLARNESGLTQRVPDADEQNCPACDGSGELCNQWGQAVPCDECKGTGSSNRSSRR